MANKKMLTLMLIISIFLVNSVMSKFSSCEEAVDASTSELEIIESMKFNIEPFLKDHAKCVELLILTGNYDSSQFLLDSLLNRGIKFKDSLKKSVSNIEMQLKEFYNKFRFEQDEFQLVVPVIQWAQSLNNVFLYLKFSHRHDAPGCPEVKNLNIDLLPHELYLTAYCIQADIPIKFELKLPFFVNITAEESTHSAQSNGRYIFTLMKGQTGMYWDRLVKEISDYPKHTRLWLEMHEKYKSEIENFINDDEDEEFKQLMDNINKKKKKGRKKKVKFEKN